jgi:membrane-associated phospholipid phosphatase
MVFIPVIYGLTQNNITKRAIYLNIVGGFIVLIMLSRLSAGCHYLTDVTVAVLFNSAIYAAGRLAFNKINI